MNEESTNECKHMIRICGYTHGMCAYAGHIHDCPNHTAECVGNTLTLNQIMSLYEQVAVERNKRTGTLELKTVREIITSVRKIFTDIGLTGEESITIITRKLLEDYAEKKNEENERHITTQGRLYRLQQIFSRWARREYDKMGYDVRAIDLPEITNDFQRYQTKPMDRLVAVAQWYRSLSQMDDKTDHTFVMLIYRYAMRNGDIFRLRWNNLEVRNGRTYLVYQPHKTRLTTKRVIRARLNPIDAADLAAFRGEAADDALVINTKGYGRGARLLTTRLNADMRRMGFTGSKGLYELRKICINTHLRVHGRDVAEAISGDTWKTLSKHYADINTVEVPSLSDEQMVE